MGRHKKSIAIEARYGQSIRDLLFDRYVTREQSLGEIAQEFEISRRTIYSYLIEYQIPIRSFRNARAAWWDRKGKSDPRLIENMRRVQREYREQATEGRAAYYRSHPGRFERIALDHLKAKGISALFQVAIGPYIVDFIFPERKLIVEVTNRGVLVNTGEDYQTRRRRFLEEQGYTIRYVIHTSRSSAYRLTRLLEEALE